LNNKFRYFCSKAQRRRQKNFQGEQRKKTKEEKVLKIQHGVRKAKPPQPPVAMGFWGEAPSSRGYGGSATSFRRLWGSRGFAPNCWRKFAIL